MQQRYPSTIMENFLAVQPTPEQIAEIRAAQQEYERTLESIWNDMIFEFEMKYGWTEEEAEEYFEKYT